MLHSRTYEGRPPWGRAVYTALHGARLSSVPSGDQSANPAVFQGAAVSSERFSQSLPPRNVAELGGSPPLRGSLEQLDRPSPAGPPFQGTELAALSTPETSLERLVPLVDYSAAWAAKCVSMGHAHCRTRLCGALPQPFYGRAGSGNGTRSGHSPEGGDHRGGPCSRQRVQVLQPYFIVPGKGVASVLDLS